MTDTDPKALLDSAQLVHSSKAVQAALDQLAINISNSIGESNPIVICVMGGGVVFAGHLLTRLQFPLQLDYVHATRYQDKTVGKELVWHAAPKRDLTGRTILLLDDILDEGITLLAIKEKCYELGAKEVYTSVFADKTLPTPKPVQADFVGLTVPNAYVFGFGMDAFQWWRNLDAIYALPPEKLG